jgi:gluconolactonase
MQIFANDMGFPEAPVLLPDGDMLFVEMSPDKGWVIRLSADGRSRKVLAKTGRPNGLARDRAGNIWIAETAQRGVLKMTLDGGCEMFANASQGERFLFLNDLAFAPNGDLYVTDSGILLDTVLPGGEVNPDYRSLDYDGRVYRIDVRTKQVDIVDRGFEFTNGLAFGPDGALYVAETLTGNIYRYPMNGARPAGRQLFSNVLERFDPAVLQGPDGMKFGADGNLYAAVFGQGDITVLGKRGEIVKRIKTQGSHPTNLSFGQHGAQKIYVTEVDTGTVQVFDVDTDGFDLYG